MSSVGPSSSAVITDDDFDALSRGGNTVIPIDGDCLTPSIHRRQPPGARSDELSAHTTYYVKVIQRRKYNPDTIRRYIRAVEEFAQFFSRSPDPMGSDESRANQ